MYLEGSDPVHGDKPTREELGFSQDDVILCSFNQVLCVCVSGWGVQFRACLLKKKALAGATKKRGVREQLRVR